MSPSERAVIGLPPRLVAYVGVVVAGATSVFAFSASRLVPSALADAGFHYHVVGDVAIAVGGFVLALAVTGAHVPGRRPRAVTS